MVVTPELRTWMQENLARGCAPAEMVDAMVRVGHPVQFAKDTVNQTVARLNRRLDTASVPSRSVPEPLRTPLASGSAFIEASDRKIAVLATFTKPRLMVLQGVLSSDECDALIAESRPKLQRSHTVSRIDGGTELNAARTSEGTHFFHDESPLLDKINRRISVLTAWPLSNGEPLQILHYQVGAQYEPHFDFFDPEDPGTEKLVASGGQRVATLIIYLNQPEEGGATTFPDLGLEVAPIKGNAVFFSYETAEASNRTLHAGTPVIRGEKWIATRWMRERPYV